jgi:Tfp pilus assembly protein PilF
MTKTLKDLMQSGYNAFTNNDYSQTISHCEAVLSIAPDNAEAHHLMSHAYKSIRVC